MNRRALLAALPAALSVGAVPVFASAAVQESAIMQLFRRHQEIGIAAEAFYRTGKMDHLSPDEADEHLDIMFYNECDRIEEEMMALPCQTAGEFAAKVIVATSKGGNLPDWDDSALFAEARALVA